jgi:hypothetical protein
MTKHITFGFLSSIMRIALCVSLFFSTSICQAQYFRHRYNITGVTGTESELKNPAQVTFLSDGTFYVADYAAAPGSPNKPKAVKHFNRDGSFIKAFGTFGNGPGQFYENRGGTHDIAVNSLGHAFISDIVSVKEFDGFGTYIKDIYSTQAGVYGLYVDENDNLWMGESKPGGRTIIRVGTTTPSISTFDIPGLGLAFSICRTSNGSFVCSDAGSGRQILYFDVAGNLIRRLVSTVA